MKLIEKMTGAEVAEYLLKHLRNCDVCQSRDSCLSSRPTDCLAELVMQLDREVKVKRRKDLYDDPETAQKDFSFMCSTSHCRSCPYNNGAAPQCITKWLFEEVEDVPDDRR